MRSSPLTVALVLIVTLFQEAKPCEYHPFDPLNGFIAEGFDIGIRAPATLIKSSYGHQFHPGCEMKWGFQFNVLLKESIQEGLACLRRLEIKQGVFGDERNSLRLENYFSKNQATIVCSEKAFDETHPGNPVAYTETRMGKELSSPRTKPPYISINPSFPSSPLKIQEWERLALKRTLFHEQFHLLGELHGEGVEHGYTCADCCFPADGFSEDYICKLCSGTFSDITDEDYLRSLVFFSEAKKKKWLAFTTIELAIEKGFEVKKGLTYYAHLLRGPLNPVGKALGHILTERYKLSAEERKIIEGTSKVNQQAWEQTRKSATVIGRAILAANTNRDKLESATILDKNKELILIELENLRKLNGDMIMVHQNITEALKELFNSLEGEAHQTKEFLQKAGHLN